MVMVQGTHFENLSSKPGNKPRKDGANQDSAIVYDQLLLLPL